jgi:hypothetical protein
MTRAERQRLYRQRRSAGLRVLRIAIDEEVLAELVRKRLIDPRSTEHHPDLEDAFGRMLVWLAYFDRK